MAASAKPRGNVSEKQGSDVKQEPEASEVQEPITDEQELELEETDLEEFSKDDKKIPYSRFKEVNEKSKALEEELQSWKSRYQSDLQRELETAELRIMNRIKREQEAAEYDSVLDPSEREIRSLKDEINRLRGDLGGVTTQLNETQLETKLRALKVEYPEADDLAVLGWMKVNPKADLGDLMRESHTRNKGRVESALRNLLENKKKKAKQRIPSGPGRIEIKPDKPITSIKDAGEAAKRFFNR